MAQYRRISQKPIRGGRTPLPASVIRDIYYEVERQARRFNVSRSFVIATALASVFGIEEQEDYRRARESHQRRRERNNVR